MHRAKYLLIALLAALPILGWAAVAHAQSFRSGDNITVPAGKVINSTLYAAGRTLDIAGTVNGDVFCAGQDITISGQVRGDVLCAGQNITISGRVSGDVRLMGQDIKVAGAVDGSATIGAQTFILQQDGTVGRDMTVGGQDATLNGTVGRDVTGGVSTLNVNSTVGRNIAASVQRLKLEGGAKVGGAITYTSPNKLSQSNGAQVAGSVTQHASAKHQTQHRMHLWAPWPALAYLYLTLLVAALVLVLLFPRVFEHAALAARSSLGKTFLVGLLAGIVVPLLLLGLMVSIIGIPLAILGGLAWLLLVLLAGPFAAYLLGRLLLRGQTNAILVMLLGAAILFLLYLLPWVGFLVWMVATWFGLGTILLQVRKVGRPHYRVGVPAPQPALARAGRKAKA